MGDPSHTVDCGTIHRTASRLYEYRIYRFIHERDSTTIRYWWVCEVVPAGFAAGRRRLGRAVVVRVPAHEPERDLSILSSYLIIYSLFTWLRLEVKEEAELHSAPSSGYTDGQAG